MCNLICDSSCESIYLHKLVLLELVLNLTDSDHLFFSLLVFVDFGRKIEHLRTCDFFFFFGLHLILGGKLDI